ncbi:unnamed protein product [Protopolystoma xenopodis]|uniref:Uncharacterized protein n=1 Tax=Protopolystoma xenopodis TaxID=117903 RepID=A0A448X7C7_9PLAT|nr:unnamed protein product [Protopolystoma xenopodis]
MLFSLNPFNFYFPDAFLGPLPLRISSVIEKRSTMKRADLLRLFDFFNRLTTWSQRLIEANIELCVFCRNNNETFDVYTSHKVSPSSALGPLVVLTDCMGWCCPGDAQKCHQHFMVELTSTSSESVW